MYNQKSFGKALETAGFRKDRSIYQFGTEFYVTPLKGGVSVVVTLGPSSLTASLLKYSKEGSRVLDHFSTNDQAEFLQKVQSWGLR